MVTGNANKAREVAAFFGGLVEVTHVTLDLPEHRSGDVGEIAAGKARFAFGQLNTPLIVDDTGFSIRALNGFPGPYAAYVQQSIGNPGILKLMEGRTDRAARFTTAIAYADAKGVRVFPGILDGQISQSPRGEGGFGYDPIFEIGNITLAEIPLEEKSRISHRALALAAFHNWFMQEHPAGGRL
ncbi:RdgB/HAM1 family non-canonical purine NTP pyrophosphatase [uncultured Methanoregula sp.]|uniref:RdgB/HAM1 family non-canonical purine NTP pyrophosphatase n=1 Tax=uncultured Methanoregula sp. TaxID=1005933 RepID=UPI002AABAFF7|nr:RdgB/HAM1 family non-canonical purine NTP pyrophosphatase [uncultured Methanoregula sp.]